MKSKKPNGSQAIEVITSALTRIQASDQRRRNSMVQLRQKYSQLESLKHTMSQKDLERFEEIAELIRALEQSE